MFHKIPPQMLKRMQELETLDTVDRVDGIPHLQRLRQIPPETGKFLALMCASAPAGKVIEIGASAGYSAMWLSLACQTRGDRLVTFEVLPEKVELANETFRLAGVDTIVDLVHKDARLALNEYNQVAFCFLDAEKEVYQDCYDKIISNLVRGGLLIADNIISHKEQLAPFVSHAVNDHRIDAVVIPIGKGELVCRKT
ncbi:MAG: O-methyltransferase [Anaerolineales bacterium]|nr:O-methyltransferase [Anaerolineales bacterium]